MRYLFFSKFLTNARGGCNSKKRILFIGAVNKGCKPLGGEEYKNSLLVEVLAARYDLHLIDTFKWKSNPLVMAKVIFMSLVTSDYAIVISASSHSVYRYLQLTSLFPKVSRRIIYFVIGGLLPDKVLAGAYSPKIYSRLASIVVEGKSLQVKLMSAGLDRNVSVIPNFKRFPDLQNSVYKTSCDFKFVFVSRVTPAKGVREIIHAFRLLEKNNPSLNCALDFWGPIDDDFSLEFSPLIGGHISYKGYLDLMDNPHYSYDVLRSYDCMLFMTKWVGEGFPGVIIDAFVAGLPVIASNWGMNSDLVRDGYNGFIVNGFNVDDLTRLMLFAASNRGLMALMGDRCREEAHKYHIDNVSKSIWTVIESLS